MDTAIKVLFTLIGAGIIYLIIESIRYQKLQDEFHEHMAELEAMKEERDQMMKELEAKVNCKQTKKH